MPENPTVHQSGDTPGVAACGSTDGPVVEGDGANCHECLGIVAANIAADHGLEPDDRESCPTCTSPRPTAHPAVQEGGEVELCRDPFHVSTPEGRAMLERAGDPGRALLAEHDATVAAADHRAGIEALRAQAPTPGKRPAQSWQAAPYNKPDEVADALEHLARLLRARVAPVPTSLTLSLFVSSLVEYDPDRDRDEDRVDREPAIARDLVRAMGGGTWAKTTQDSSGYGSPDYLKLEGMLGVIPSTVWVTRDAVCERVVVGRQTVEHPATEELVIPARAARTEVVEQVEWRCAPLLGAAAETGADVTL